MGSQVSFTIDDNLITQIDKIAAKIGHSRSDTISTILWLAVQKLRTQPNDFGELIQNVSGGTGVTTPASFQVEKEFRVVKENVLEEGELSELQQLQSKWKNALEENWGLGIREHTAKYQINRKPQLFHILKTLETSPRKKVKLSGGQGQEFTQDFIAIDESLKPVKLHVRYVHGAVGVLVEAQVESINPKDYDLTADKIVLLAGRLIRGGEA
jgi:hypothetical protein